MGLEYLPDHMGENKLPTDRKTISEWAVYLPDEVDRSKYIETCFLTNTITLTNANAEVKHRVRISKEALREVRFPVDSTDLGSEVICVTSPFSEKLFVVAVFDPITFYTEQKENQYRFNKSTSDGYADLVIDGQNGVVQIGVRSEQSGGIVSINVTNANKTAQYKITVNGTHVVQTNGDIDFTSFNGNFNISSKAIKLLDGSLGGLVEVANLTTKLNNLENLVNDLISKYNIHTHILTLSSGTGTAAPTVSLETGTLTPTVRGDIENTHITHGNPS